MKHNIEIVGLFVGIALLGACRQCTHDEPVIDSDASVVVPVIELGDAEVLTTAE